MKNSIATPSLLLCAALCLGAPFLSAQVIEDDFNDGDDGGWSRYLPLEAFGAAATFSFPDGNSYRIQSAASPSPEQLGAARAGSHQGAAVYEAFRVEVDIVNWDSALDQDIGVLGSLSSVGVGTTNGYAFTYDTGVEGAYLSVLTGEQPTTLSSSPVSLVPGQSYRFVLQGFFDVENFVGELRGEIFEIDDLENPLVSVSGFETSYPSGTCGVFNRSTSDAGATDATFDNYFSTSVTDVDRDGMTDQWEFDYFGELFWFADEDFDGDGQTNLAEFLGGTDPTDPDDPGAQVSVPVADDLGIIGNDTSVVTLDTFGSGLDTEIGLYDAAGNLLDNNDDAVGTESELVAQSLSEGTYYVAVSTYDTAFGASGFEVSGGDNAGGIVLNYSDGLDIAGSATAVLDGADGVGGVAWFSFEIGDLPVVIRPVADDLGIIGDDTSVVTLDTFGSVLGNTEMGLYDAAGNLLDENDDAGDGSQSELAALALAEGTYYVAVSTFDTTFGASGFDVLGGGNSGEVVLNFSDGLGVTGSANAVLDGADGVGGVAWFSFGIEAAPPVVITPVADDLGIIGNGASVVTLDTFGSGLDTELGLYDAAGNLLDNNDDAVGTESELLLILPEGTYYVAVSTYNTAFGASGFEVSGGDNAGGIVLNYSDGLDIAGSATAVLDGADGVGGVAWFSFGIEAAPPVVITPVADELGIIGNDTSVVTLDTFGSGLDTELGLYDAAGNLLDNNDDAGAGTQSELFLILPEGTYYVAVSTYDTTFGASGFVVLGGGNSGEVVLNYSDGLDIAGSATAVLDGADAARGVAWFSFEIGDVPVVIRPVADDLGIIGDDTSVVTLDTFGSVLGNTEMGLYDAAGNLLDENDDAGDGSQSELAALALTEGTYYVAVSTFDTTFGGSGFDVLGGGNSGEVVLNFSDGLGVTGSANAVLDGADAAGGVAWFSFGIEAAPPVVITPVADDLGIIGDDTSVITLDTFGSGLDTEVGLYDAEGNLLDENDDAVGTESELVAQSLSEGTYYVAVSTFNTTFGASGFVVSGGNNAGGIVLNYSDGLDIAGSATAVLDGADGVGGVAWFSFEIGDVPVVITPVADELGIIGDDTSVVTLDTFGSALADTEMGLYDAAGNLLDENDEAGDGSQSELVVQNLAEGAYYVAVSTFDTTFGASGFDVLGGGNSGEVVLNFSDGLGVTGSATAVLDGVDAAGGVAWFFFEIEAAPPVVITPVADDLGIIGDDTSVITLDTFGSALGDTEMGLYDAAGNLLDNNDDTGAGAQSELVAENLAEGTYYVAVSTYNTAFGASGFVVSGGNNAGGIVLNFSDGLNIAGSATAVLDGADGVGGVAWFSFEIGGLPVVITPVADELGIIGDDTSVVTLDTFGSALADTEMGLYDAAGNLLDENDEAGDGSQSELVVQNLAEGAYYVAVSTFDTTFGASGFDVLGGGNSGEVVLNYSDGLGVTGSATAVLDGADAAGGVAWFFFEIEAAPPVVITPVADDLGIIGDDTSVITLDTFGSEISDTELGLYDAGGNLLDNNDDAEGLSQSALSFENLPAGTYYVAASAYNTSFRPDFDVNVLLGQSGGILLNYNGGSATASVDQFEPIAWFSFEIEAAPSTAEVGPLGIRVAGGALTVGFAAEDGWSYRLETSPDLQNWSPAPGATLSVENGAGTFLLPVAGQDELYFRVFGSAE